MGLLYVVATPIGNMSDLTPRALEVLGQVSFIAAEDTRVSGMMLERAGIKKRLVSYHKFNELEKSCAIIDKLIEGESVALITDAGTPCISDPGSILVKKAVEAGIEVVGIPGASATVLALSVSGFNTESFAFYGFFPRNKKEQIEFCNKILNDSVRCAVIYESPKRILKTLEAISENLNNCLVCLCNDLTKKFEKIYRGTPSEVLELLKNNEKYDLGEYVIVLEKPDNIQIADKSGVQVSIEARIFDLYLSGHTIKDAVEILTLEGVSRNEAYSAGLTVKKYINQ